VKKKVQRPYQALSTTSLPTVLAAEEVATTTVPEVIQLIDSPSPTLVAGAGSPILCFDEEGNGRECTREDYQSAQSAQSAQRATFGDFWTYFLASPRLIAGMALGLIAILVGFALLLAICIKRKIQHPRLIMTGVLLLVLIAILLVFNQTLGIASIDIQ